MDNFIFLHGALGTSQDLAPLMDIFREKKLKVHSFNFSGHGKESISPHEFRIELFAKDLDTFIKQNNIQNPIIFGYGIGGYVALYYQSFYESSNAAMICTYGTKFNWTEKSVQKELLFLDPEYIENKLPQVAELLTTKHGVSWKQLVISTSHMMQNLEKLDGLRKEDVEDISIPVLFLLGDQDRVVTSEETTLTCSWIKGAKFKSVSHSKHELERSNLKEIVDIILEALE
jgi:pimeloyl-ACP methyl ester carboxylesterase